MPKSEGKTPKKCKRQKALIRTASDTSLMSTHFSARMKLSIYLTTLTLITDSSASIFATRSFGRAESRSIRV